MLRRTIYLLIVLACSGCAGNVARDAHHDHPEWSYAGSRGPGYWAEEYPACAESGGSPIDIGDTKPAALPPLQPNYSSTEGSVRDTGHSIQVDTRGGSLAVGDRAYRLVQFHFHIPSEHRYHGSRYEGTIHLVHADSEGRLAVVDVPVTSGDASPVMDRILENIDTRGTPTLRIADALPEDLSYFAYDGSLTTPPCSGGVQWYVLANPVTWSSEQLHRLGQYHHGNTRPVQPLGSRTILFSGEP